MYRRRMRHPWDMGWWGSKGISISKVLNAYVRLKNEEIRKKHLSTLENSPDRKVLCVEWDISSAVSSTLKGYAFSLSCLGSPTQEDRPPSTAMFCPYTKEESSDAKNNMTFATSCGVPKRCGGKASKNRCITSGVVPFKNMGVAVALGEMQLMRIPMGA